MALGCMSMGLTAWGQDAVQVRMFGHLESVTETPSW